MNLNDEDVEAPDLDAELRAGFQKIKGDLEAPEKTTGSEVPLDTKVKAEEIQPEKTEKVVEKTTIQTEVERNDKGQFTKRKPPGTWRKEAIAKWDTLDPTVQDEVDRREREIMDGIKQYKTRADMSESWEKAVQPYMATIQSLGLAPQQAIQSLLGMDHTFRYGTQEQKAMAARAMLQNYGIQIDHLKEEQVEIDPRFASIQQENQQIKAYLQQKEMEERERMRLEATGDVDNFKKNHEHYDAVKEDMARLVTTGLAVGSTRAEMLQDAYDKAVWGRADLRTQLLAEQQDKLVKESASIAAKAKEAAAVNVPVKGKVPATAPQLSVDDELRAGVRKLGLFDR